MASHCKFWLPKKKRFCANSPLFDSPFCGNHTQRSDAQWIPCPIDPSHSVLEENLQSHLNRCPLLKQAQSLSCQPFYQKGINSGREDEEEEGEEMDVVPKDSIFTSEMKRSAVYAMSAPRFLELIAKIKSVHASICNSIPDSFRIPEACSIWTNREVDKKLPYQEKHVLQQASILGNLEEFGVLRKASLISNATTKQCDSNRESERDADVSAVVEFGAGRGYLTQMLADCYGIKKVLLVERKSYKLKADRSLRQKESLVLERLRIDIEDLNLNAVESLQGVGYMAIGKHLCGPATDVTLRCCIRQQSNENTDAQSQASCYLRGLAIATCCHHLCQWKNYINKRYISELGFTKEDFNAISWFTSWAVDADHGAEFSVTDCSAQLEIMSEKKEGGAESELCGVGDIVRSMRGIGRAVLGYMCKDIIDGGRVMWVKEQGLKSELVKYVPSSISPENHLLVARWTFALVMVYFALATVVSVRGCRIYARKPLGQIGERDKFIKKDSEDINSGKPSVSKGRKSKGFIKLELHHNPTPNEQLGFLENLLQIIYQTCAGAAMLTDIVFWCLLLPFTMGKDFQLTLLIGCMHSVNVVFLILESALNRLPFTWFGLVYFVLWSCAYVVFQWVLHACCFTWWPYPFLDLSTPWAPLWYLALGLVHIPCYGLYVLLKKAKNAAFSRMFPQKFVRSN